MQKFTRLVAMAVVVLSCVSGAQALTMDTVHVTNPGNAPDTRYATPGYGGVAYTYKIGTYEVTAGQYCEFLNAVAKKDPYGLYNAEMDSNSAGCQITRNGTVGSYTYDFSGGTVEVSGSTAADWENRPVNFVSWADAARFTNWMHNGQPTGMLTGFQALDAGLTEDGSYNLEATHPYYDPDGSINDNSALWAALTAVNREADARWAIPSEDEWYKAAYHKNDGVTGNYFDYPTSNDSVPDNGNPGGDSGNTANYCDEDYTIGSPYWRTNVGLFAQSESPYGTFDQGGNVWEWIEDTIPPNGVILQGGSFGGSESDLLAATGHTNHPTVEFDRFGFRVAFVPEPATLFVFTAGIPLALKRKRKSRP